MTKYDQITGRMAAAWEQHRHPPKPDTPHWFGFCHAWSAASVLEEEPAAGRAMAARNGASLAVGIGDLKAWLCACHTNDVANSYGERCEPGQNPEGLNDFPPDLFWNLLKVYVKDRGVPLVLDIEAGPEVWNFPVFAYKLRYAPLDNTNLYEGNLTISIADDNVEPDFVGVKVGQHDYQFTFRMRNGSCVMGSAKWTGASRRDHPDFAWYPYLARAENPEVYHETVLQLLRAPASPSRPEPAVGPTTPPRPQPNVTQPPRPQPGVTQPARPQPGVTTPPRPESRPEANPPSRPEPSHPDTSPGSTRPPEAVAVTVRPSNAIVLSPRDLVALVANKTSSFEFDANVDRSDGGQYYPGETFTVRVMSAKAGYLYLLHLDSNDELSLLYPLPGQDNRIEADRAVVIPRETDRFAFRLTEPVGVNRVKAIVTSRPLVLTGLVPATAVQQQSRQERLEKPEPPNAAHQSADLPAVRQRFRWHPTLRRQILALLHEYQEKESLSREAIGAADPRVVLGDFAQDEVAFYVDARKSSQQNRKTNQDR